MEKVLRIDALIAQRLEQRTHNPLVGLGSNPPERTIYNSKCKIVRGE
jgi:hypothetical protein